MKLIFNLITKFTLGGKMSEEGADKAGMELYKGFKFCLITLAVCSGLALIFWQLPNLADFIIKLKHG